MAGIKTPNDHAEPTKSRTLKNTQKNIDVSGYQRDSQRTDIYMYRFSEVNITLTKTHTIYIS